MSCNTEKNENQPSPNQQVGTWLSELTLEQKADLVVGVGSGHSSDPGLKVKIRVPGAAGATYPLPELGIPSLVLSDGPAGLRIEPEREGSDQTYYCTAFPIATLLASSWDTELVEEVGKAFGEEIKEYGVDVLLSPALNIHRNPLTGRNFEYYSEDPYVSGNIASALIRGIESKGVGATAKHFVANNSEFNRTNVNTHVNERALREIYLRSFEILVKKEQPWAIMSAYNKINGTYASESKELLQTILRDEWGYEGIVMTDWYAGQDVVAQMKAGNDLIMPGLPSKKAEIIEAVKSGELDEKDLDRNVGRILEMVMKSPVYNEYAYSDKPDLKANATLARKAASEGIVLLKNDQKTLPLNAEGLRIAAYGIGSYEFIAGGTGSGDVNEAYIVSLAEGLANAGMPVDSGLEQVYRAYLDETHASMPQKTDPLLPDIPLPEMPLASADVARQAAQSDIALITLGRNSGEFVDRELEGDFYLTNTEKSMIEVVSRAYHGAGKKVIMVLNIGNVIETASWRDQVDGIVLAWQGGQEAGNALSDVLTGKVNPSGKLATTFVISYDDVPSSKTFPGKKIPGGKLYNPIGLLKGWESEITYHDGIMVGYRHYLSEGVKTAYPFGYGLSYSDFAYSDLTLGGDHFDGKITARINITNTGDIAGKEVVQLYLSAPGKSLHKPVQELKGFAKTNLLQPGQSQIIEFTLRPRDLTSFDPEQSAWLIEAGEYTLKVGASAEDIRQEARFSAKAQVVEKTNRVILPDTEL